MTALRASMAVFCLFAAAVVLGAMYVLLSMGVTHL